MSTFAPHIATPEVKQPDPSKRVNYVLGMVLGVDDFTQEFAYLSGRDQWLARDLFGYGAICGLRVAAEPSGRGPRIAVSSGAALNGLGQLICVKPAQCAYLNDWLAANKAALLNLGLSPPNANLRLYVTLCYRECKVDPIPIPGEPCRTEEDLMAPSRLADDFQLELRLTAPDQREYDLVREFVDWLRQAVHISDGPGPFTTLSDFLAEIRKAARLDDPLFLSPPGQPHFALGSPLVSLQIPSAAAPDYLRAALRLWTTEIRPRVHVSAPGSTGCCGDAAPAPSADGCLLLAQVDVPIVAVGPSNDWMVHDQFPVVVSEHRRPFLLHTGLLQELLMSAWGRADSAAGPPVNVPQPADTVVAEQAYNRVPNAGSAPTFSRSDHTHGSPPNLMPAHVANVAVHNAHQIAGDVTGTLGASTVAALRNAPVTAPVVANDGQALVFRINPSRWDFQALAVAGDVTGALGATTVAALRNAPLPTPAAANDGQMLVFRTNPARWELQAPGAAAGPFVQHLNLPAGSAGYRIVAAARIVGNNTVRGVAYNGLRITGFPEPGVLNLTFVGYTNPDAAGSTTRYVVKILPELLEFPTPRPAITVAVLRFNAADFSVFITQNGQPLPDASRPRLILNVEISQY
jgi:hypothetical protein